MAGKKGILEEAIDGLADMFFGALDTTDEASKPASKQTIDVEPEEKKPAKKALPKTFNEDKPDEEKETKTDDEESD